METYNGVMEGHGTQNFGLTNDSIIKCHSVVSRVVLLYRSSVNNRQLQTGSVWFQVEP